MRTVTGKSRATDRTAEPDSATAPDQAVVPASVGSEPGPDTAVGPAGATDLCIPYEHGCPCCHGTGLVVEYLAGGFDVAYCNMGNCRAGKNLQDDIAALAAPVTVQASVLVPGQHGDQQAGVAVTVHGP